jgi:2',3'-cyclic-nucleotide 2'-phosphodiesterase (5'-nucleotidase family)
MEIFTQAAATSMLTWLALGTIARAATAEPATAEPATPAVTAAAPAPNPALEIIYHGDLDGQLATPPCGKAAGASARDYAAVVGRLGAARAEAAAAGHPAPVVLMGGNLATPDLFGEVLIEQGAAGAAALAELFARAGYDAVGVGHHELSLAPPELDRLLAALAARGLPPVLTNLRCDAKKRATCPAVHPDLLVRRGEASVGVVATLSPAVVSGIPAAAFHGLSLDDPATAARAAIRGLRARGARVVVLMAQEPRDDRALEELDGLARRLGDAPAGERPDVILGGGLADEDTDRAVRLLRRDGAPPVVGSPGGTAGLTRVTLTAGAAVAVEGLATTGAAPDPQTRALLDPEIKTYCARYGTPLEAASSRGSFTRDAFTKYVLEVMRRQAGAEIAIINRAFIKRGPFPVAGAITRAELYRALPYRAVVGLARLPGASVESVLGPTLDKPGAALVGLARAGGGLQVNGRDLDKARAYRVVTIGFVAAGGDSLVPASGLPWHPLPDEPDLRDAVERFLVMRAEAAEATAGRPPDVDPLADLGPPASQRPLVVALTDVGADLASTSIANGPNYTDAQLVRAQQLTLNGNATGVLQVRDPRHEVDGRLDLKYGWSNNQPPGGPAVSGETVDLITFTTEYNYRGLRDIHALLKAAVPDPYVRVWIESEFTRPDVTPTQPRTYHHLQMTDTAGALFTLMPKLRVRGGVGAQSELLASGDDGRWNPVIEAGGTLDPVAIATVGPLAVKLEGLVDYDFIDPGRLREHQVRGTGKLSVPLLPTLFITVGLNVFAVERERLGWGASYDGTVGLRVHLDAAYQRL